MENTGLVICGILCLLAMLAVIASFVAEDRAYRRSPLGKILAEQTKLEKEIAHIDEYMKHSDYVSRLKEHLRKKQEHKAAQEKLFKEDLRKAQEQEARQVDEIFMEEVQKVQELEDKLEDLNIDKLLSRKKQAKGFLKT